MRLAFIIGKGQPPEKQTPVTNGDSKPIKKGGGEWEAICKLMNEPMPILQSRLLQSSSVESSAINVNVEDGKAAADKGKEKIVTRSLALAAPGNVSSQSRPLHPPSHISAARSASAGTNRPKPSGGQQEVSSSHFLSDVESKEELAFQQLMLEGVANSSATTEGSIRDLLS